MSAISCHWPALPGLTGPRSYAPSPVWSGSTTKPVCFRVLRRTEAARLYHQARAFERQTREPGEQDGAVGRNGLAILHALIFDCLNYASGQLDPSYEAIARFACISVRSVARGLQALRDAGILTWVRRCAESMKDGRFTLEQQSNAYGLVPPTQWRGYQAPAPVPVPETGTWGEHPCGAREALTEAAAEVAAGSELAAIVRQLESDAANPLAAVLARLGRSIGAKTPEIYRSASLTKNHSRESLS